MDTTIDLIVRAAQSHYRRENTGAGQPVGCTAVEIEEMLARFRAKLPDSPCRQYIEFLRLLDGIMYDGDMIYAHKTHPLFGPGAVTSPAVGLPDIDGIVELNAFHRERSAAPDDVVVYGSSGIHLFLGFGEDRFCLVPWPSVPGENLVRHLDLEFGSFNEMLKHIFRQLLGRAHDRGDIK